MKHIFNYKNEKLTLVVIDGEISIFSEDFDYFKNNSASMQVEPEELFFILNRAAEVIIKESIKLDLRLFFQMVLALSKEYAFFIEDVLEKTLPIKEHASYFFKGLDKHYPSISIIVYDYFMNSYIPKVENFSSRFTF